MWYQLKTTSSWKVGVAERRKRIRSENGKSGAIIMAWSYSRAGQDTALCAVSKTLYSDAGPGYRGEILDKG